MKRDARFTILIIALSTMAQPPVTVEDRIGSPLDLYPPRFPEPPLIKEIALRPSADFADGAQDRRRAVPRSLPQQLALRQPQVRGQRAMGRRG